MSDDLNSPAHQRWLRTRDDVLRHAPLQAVRHALMSRCSSSLEAWLVGGALRDLLLGVQPREYDIAVNGDAIRVGRQLAAAGGRFIAEHPAFGTCEVELLIDGSSPVRLDIAGLRSEHYSVSGALPDVAPAHDIAIDLVRRDFTINSLALQLTPGLGDGVIDMCGGAVDLTTGMIRVLHDDSFLDDPTRIFRAARYAARYGELESHTQSLIDRAVECEAIESISAARVMSELRLVLSEMPARQVDTALSLLDEWGLLERILPLGARHEVRLPGVDHMHDVPVAAPPDELWLARMASMLVDVDRDAIRLWCADAGMPSGEVRRLLHLAAMQQQLEHGVPVAVLLRVPRETIVDAVASWGKELTQDWLRLHDAAREFITGSDLQAHGISDGPQLGAMLHDVRTGILEGRITTREEALGMLKELIEHAEEA